MIPSAGLPGLLALAWVTPIAGAILGASILAPLVALWFLKLRRKRRTVPSTLLWSRSLADLRANAPFQRLRLNLLLLLQILCVAAIAIALAQPEAEGLGSSGGRHVILIDRSASMNATETAGEGEPATTRLALAKEAAKSRVRELLGGGWFSSRASGVMVVSFATRAEIRAPFTDSIASLESAIDAITPTDESTRLAEALELARAFSSNLNRQDDRGQVSEAAVGESAALELYSDGRIADLDRLALRAGEEIVYHRVGSARDNAAITTVSADRPPESLDRVQVFATVVNTAPEPRRVTLQLAVDGTVRAVTPEPIEVAGAKSEPEFLAGAASVVFRPIEQPSDAAIEVAIVEDDALRDDDTANVVVPPAKRLSVLHVGAGGFVVRSLLAGLPVERFASIPVDEFDALVAKNELPPWDVVVFDAVAPKSLPPGRYLSFGAAPPVDGLTAFGTQQNGYARIVRDEHPLFRSASLDELFVGSFTAVQPDKRFVVQADSAAGPLVLTLDRSDLHLVFVAFDPLDSNWPFQRSFVNFVANAVEYLGRAGDAVTGRALSPGEPIATRLPVGSRDAELTLPDGRRVKVAVGADGSVSWGPVELAGLHRLSALVPGRDAREVVQIAVNIADPAEARIDPRESLDLGTRTVQGVDVASATRGALWPWVLVAGLVLVLAEWWYYQRQIRV